MGSVGCWSILYSTESFLLLRCPATYCIYIGAFRAGRKVSRFSPRSKASWLEESPLFFFSKALLCHQMRLIAWKLLPDVDSLTCVRFSCSRHRFPTNSLLLYAISGRSLLTARESALLAWQQSSPSIKMYYCRRYIETFCGKKKVKQCENAVVLRRLCLLYFQVLYSLYSCVAYA